MIWRIPLAEIDFGPEEQAAVQRVISSKWLTMGEVTQAFEQEFAALCGVRHAVAVTNGTAALHLACLALGLGPDDEVILPSLTFVATANAVRYVGAVPVFADVHGPQDLNISPVSIELHLTPKTRAIIVVHYAGFPCDMPAILDLADKHGLFVIEDAAHAPGAELAGRKMGAWGDIGCFSFFSNKNLTTGEGGMLTTNDDTLAEKLRLLRSHGMTSLTWDRHRGHASSYDVVALGFNYRIDELRAAIGRVQLSKLQEATDRRRSRTLLYRTLLAESSPDLQIPFIGAEGNPAYHLFPVILPEKTNRDEFMRRMKDQGIQTSVHYPPIHQFEDFSKSGMSATRLPVTEEVALREVTLPLYPNLDSADIELIVDEVHAALGNPKRNSLAQ